MHALPHWHAHAALARTAALPRTTALPRTASPQADKRVFDAKALPLQPLAESMGLLAVPRLKQGGAAATKLGKNAKNKIGGQSWERGGEGEGEGDEDDDEEDDEDGDDEAKFGGAAAGSEDDEEEEGEEDEEEDEEDEDGELVLRPKTRKGTPRDRLTLTLALTLTPTLTPILTLTPTLTLTLTPTLTLTRHTARPSRPATRA